MVASHVYPLAIAIGYSIFIAQLKDGYYTLLTFAFDHTKDYHH
jgi:hypothetical protein